MEDEKHPLDGLKLMAEEIAVAFNPEPSRRPTWAPRLQPTDEMTTLLCELKLLSAEDKPVIRLWADFTNPRRGKVHCKGFQLCAGTERGKKIWIAQYHDKQAVIASLQQKIERTPYLEIHDKYQQALRSTEQKRGGWSFGPCWVSSAQSRNRLRELGSQRVGGLLRGTGKANASRRKVLRALLHLWQSTNRPNFPGIWHRAGMPQGKRCPDFPGAMDYRRHQCREPELRNLESLKEKATEKTHD